MKPNRPFPCRTSNIDNKRKWNAITVFVKYVKRVYNSDVTENIVDLLSRMYLVRSRLIGFIETCNEIAST